MVTNLPQSILVLEGRPPPIHPYLFGATLEQKGGRVWPIAVRCTLHYWVAKIVRKLVMKDMIDLLAHQQLGYGVSGGAEAGPCC